jgi:DNA polymerase-1
MTNQFKNIVIRKPEEVENFCKSIEYADAVGLDVEGCEILEDKFHPVGRSRLFSVQFCVREDEAVYVPTFTLGREDYSSNKLAMKPFIESKKRQKVLHHPSYDFCAFFNEGMNPAGLLCDTLVAEYTDFNDNKYADGTQVERGLKPLCEKYFGMTLPDYEETFTERTGKNKRQKLLQNLLDVQLTIGGEDRIVDYAIKDPWLTLKLYRHVKSRLSNKEWEAKSRKGKSLWDFYQEFEVPFAELLMRMEWRGIPMNGDRLSNLNVHYQAENLRMEAEWQDTLKQFNAPSSLTHKGEDLINFLTNYVGLKLSKLTTGSGKENKRTGKVNEDKFAIDKKVLEDLHHPVGDFLLEWRKVEGGLERYIPQLQQYYRTHKGKCHSSYNQTGTRTKRLSSNNMNGQNFPARGKLADEVGETFEAPEGYEFGEIDGSQYEVRIMAYMANDKATKTMLREDLDQYIYTGSKVDKTIKAWFNGRTPTKALCEEAKALFPLERYGMKAIRLGYQYGMGVGKTQTTLKVTKEEARNIYNEYWRMHSGIRKFSDKAAQDLREKGRVLDLLGRPIYISGIHSVHPDENIRKYLIAKAERQAGNSRVQGTVAVLMQISMMLLDVDEELQRDGIRLLRQVHDSVTLMAPVGALEKHCQRIEYYMSKPLEAYTGTGISDVTPAILGWGKTIKQAKKHAEIREKLAA